MDSKLRAENDQLLAEIRDKAMKDTLRATEDIYLLKALMHCMLCTWLNEPKED